MEWDASPELVARIAATLQRPRLDKPLRQVLAEDFPRQCGDLPIEGGWGFSQDEAIKFIQKADPLGVPFDYVNIEYLIVEKLLYEELIIFRPKTHAFSGIEHKLKSQSVINKNVKMYDLLLFDVMCWTDWHWERLKAEWIDNEFGERTDFDKNEHFRKRNESMVRFERDYWFEISAISA